MASDISGDCPKDITNHYNVVSGVSLLVVYIAVISLNCLIIFVIFGVKHRSLRWSLDYLVSFLAITDLVSTLVGVPIPIIAYMQGYWPGSCSNGATEYFSTFNITCKLFYLFLVWGRLSTMFIITMMCIERFLAITRPFVHREIVTAGRLRKCVYGIWFVMFVYSLLPILNIGHVRLHWNKHLDDVDSKSSEPSYFFCFMEYDNFDVSEGNGLGNLIYSIVFVLFGCISLTIVLICVFFICRILLVRRPKFNKNKLSKPTSASKTYSVNAPTAEPGTPNKPKIIGKPSMLQKSRTFLAKRSPNIKKFEPEELQFIALMLMIAGVFYITFLPTMVLVICHIAGYNISETFTFWSMRLTSFVVVANPLIYGFSNKLYRIGCFYVIRSFLNMFCCKKLPVPERLGQRKMSIVSGSRCRLTPAEKAAQDFIIAASPDKGEAIARTFVGKMKIGVEGRKLETLNETLTETLTETSDQDTAPPAPVSRRNVVNFRTGTYLRETSQDLKHADFFMKFYFGRPTTSFRAPPTTPKIRTLKQSNSSPSPGSSLLANSSSESLVISNGQQQDKVTEIEHGKLQAQASLLVDTGTSQERFFDVVSDATRRLGLGASSALITTNHDISLDEAGSDTPPPRSKGYIRKGLREKLAQKAEQARLQALEKKTNREALQALEKKTNREAHTVDSGLGSETIGGKTDIGDGVDVGRGV